MTHPILELQAADTMTDQLRHRRERLPERDQVRSARDALVRWDHARATIRRRLDELTEVIERAESASRDIDRQRSGLQAKLKSVFSPREAEALQREIAALEARRSELDDAGLAALEEQARVDDELVAHLRQEESLRETLIDADAALSASEADIDGELARIAARLDELRAEVDAGVLQRYDRLRGNRVVAAAKLSGSRCDGCHLDLSAHEVDDIRDVAVHGIADCPQCGRLLVV